MKHICYSAVLLCAAFMLNECKSAAADSAPAPEIKQASAAKTEKQLFDEEIKRISSHRSMTAAEKQQAYQQALIQYAGLSEQEKYPAQEKILRLLNSGVPSAANAVISSSLDADKKFFAYESLCEYCAGIQDYDKAFAAGKQLLEFAQKLNDSRRMFRAWNNMANAYRWANQYENALSAYAEAQKFDALNAVRRASDLALDYEKPEEVDRLWQKLNNPYEELRYRNEKGIGNTPDIIQKAFSFAKDEKNKPNERVDIASRYCFLNSTNPKAEEANRILASLPLKPLSGSLFRKIRILFHDGDYKQVIALCEIGEQDPAMKQTMYIKIKLISLGMLGDFKGAAEIAEAHLNDDSLSKADKTAFRYYIALLTGQSTDSLMKGTDLTIKEQSQVILSAARQALIWNIPGAAEKLSKEYKQFFVQRKPKEMNVKYFDTPIENITQWRAVLPGLEKQYCDVPFGGSLDFIETDVSTGRNIKIDKNGSTDFKPMELTALCDRNALHIFLRMEDPKARDAENGFGRSFGGEMYFAPGENQPYICFGAGAKGGIDFDFQTTYANRNHTPFLPKNKDGGFRQETSFSDTDYVVHLIFEWQNLYNKLPQPGSYYLFDPIIWLPGGGKSWSGSQGVHEASSWGHLNFNLTPKQLAEIRKQIIFSCYRSYESKKFVMKVSENRYEWWQDEELGDPEFYEECLKPLREKLQAYAKLVKPDMTDADAAEAYHAIPYWKGFKHEIDELRKNYLRQRLMKDCR